MTAFKTQAVAHHFAELMILELSSEQLLEAVELNRTQQYENCCGTYNFTDSNAVMLAAYAKIYGLSEDNVNLNDDAVMRTMNDAWSIAKAADFAPTAIIPYDILLLR